MENKINIVELLRNCPHGMELDSPVYNNLYFDNIIDSLSYPIKCYTTNNGMLTTVFFSKYGGIGNEESAKCVIFPKGKTTWDEFVPYVPLCEFKDGDIVYFMNKYGDEYISIVKNIEGNYLNTYMYSGVGTNAWVIQFSETSFHIYNIREQRLATEEEKVKLFNKIKEHGYTWNAETKTLYRTNIGLSITYKDMEQWELVSHEIEPKFKVGDRIKTNEYEYIIVEIKDGYYLTECGNKIHIKNQDYFKLVPNKFDISTLVPFETKVLVRDHKNQFWKPAIFGGYIDDYREQYKYAVVGGSFYKYLIPYKGNEHLRCKIDDCDKYYKVW